MVQSQEDILLSLPPYRAAIAQCLLIAYQRGMQIRSERGKSSEKITDVDKPFTLTHEESAHESTVTNPDQCSQNTE